MLETAENIFGLPDPLPDALLGCHVPGLLAGLQAIAVAVWQHSGRSVGGPKRLRQQAAAAGGGVPRRATAARALAILEIVGGRAKSWEQAAQLTEALLPLLQPAGGRGKRRADEELLARTLGALSTLWSRLVSNLSATAGSGTENDDYSAAALAARQQQARRVAVALAPLAGTLTQRDARLALSAAFAALVSTLPELSAAAGLLGDLNADSTTELDEADYERRGRAYSELTQERWTTLGALSAAPLLHQCACDLRNGDDLALRHAASQALSYFIAAAAAADADSHPSNHLHQNEAGAAAGREIAAISSGNGAITTSADAASVLLTLTQRVVFPQLKRGLSGPNLSVRQEHLSLLRELVRALPGRHADLVPLTEADAEVDFLLNVAHLQLHRRARCGACIPFHLLGLASRRFAGRCVSPVLFHVLLFCVLPGRGGRAGLYSFGSFAGCSLSCLAPTAPTTIKSSLSCFAAPFLTLPQLPLC